MLSLVRRFVKRAMAFRSGYILISLIGLFLAVLEMIPPRIIGNLVSVMAKPPFTLSQVASKGLIWAAAAIAIQVVLCFQTLLANHYGELIMTGIRQEMFEKLQQLEACFYDQNQTGRIIACFGNDLDGLRNLAVWGLNTLTANGAFIILAAIMIFRTDKNIFLATVWIAPAATLLNFLYGRKVSQAWQLAREKLAEVGANQLENIAGFRVVAAFNRQVQNLARYNELQEENARANVAACKKSGFFQPCLQIVRFLGLAIILLYGGSRVKSGELQAGDLVATSLYWDWFMMPAINFGGFLNEILVGMTAADRIFKLLDEPGTMTDKAGAKILPHLNGHVRFENVSFSYLPGRPVIRDMCFDIEPGMKVALVGGTGSGKTTIMGLLARFYHPEKGKILLDGYDLANTRRQSLQSQIAVVLQNNFLFNATILENLRYGRPSAPFEQVVEAARVLGCHDRIMALPDGYETALGSKGAILSVGEKQLLCFTRALIADPRLLLLDEATSAMDLATEQRIQAALFKLAKNRTTFIVTHRLNLAQFSDLILVLEDGRIIEQGTHTQLVDSGGVYGRLFEGVSAPVTKSSQTVLHACPH